MIEDYYETDYEMIKAYRAYDPRGKASNEELAMLAKGGDRKAFDALCEGNAAYVFFVARRAGLYNLDRNEMIYYGFQGIEEAVRGYDAGRCTKFLTYAAKAVYGNLCRAARISSIEFRTESIDRIQDKEDSERNKPLEPLQYNNDFYHNDALDSCMDVIEKRKLYDALAGLSPRERRLINYRFGFERYTEGHDRKKSAAHFCITMTECKRIETKALEFLRKQILSHT